MAVGEIKLGSGPTPVLRVPSPPVLEWLELGADDRTPRFIGLTSDLGRSFDPFGDGKRITSGHAYAGNDAAVAWTSVCRDPLGGAFRQSVETFAERWRAVRGSAPAEPCHYVSFGPGDGRKDGVVLSDLSTVNRDLCYLPVDTSVELLHLAIRGLVRRVGLPTDRVMSLPWDFSLTESVSALRRLLDEMFGSTPVLFSLLGNTIAHFDNDVEVLRLLGCLLNPGDRLLLEVEATAAVLPQLAAPAADELAQSPAFREFATSALRHHTDLHPGWDDVEFTGGVESDRALVVKTLHRADEDTVLTLPNGATTRFALDDTVRVGLSRKYSALGLAELVAGADLSIVGDKCTRTSGPFGLALLMLERPE
ncbi:L-histidine N(alpha)-methyltransferase [Actinophytocola oryzae]|uniref:Putative SAM-dependent methyltransferase n=1 Tax=Actinophytocola oryzae TaxID=502181 RepID=A0A4R7VQN9_9PSEU|nr:L-histidine N(alpha)-methyltransferase [Actinophytocola oryzae]TDV52070.1 putative SAM-dependent methyltransferase [Actinophytocola oryzae]